MGWFLDRSGLGAATEGMRAVGEKLVPANISWLYTMGSLALFYFSLQVVTGCLLLTMYVPDDTRAFASIQSIEHRAHLGWLVRQMHSWGASFIAIVLLLHLFKVLWYGSYKRPREFTWFIGCILLATTLGFCFSGYLLPWNQLSFWATRVAMAAVDSIPAIGPELKSFICGGADVTGRTLGRFFSLHVIVLPATLLVLVVWHLALVTYKGSAPKTSVTEELKLGHEAALWKNGAESFFPRQVYRDLFVCNIGFALLVTVATFWPWEIGEPASLQTPEGIKPEWYFLPMYQFLKYFDDNLYAAVPFLGNLGLAPDFLGVLCMNLVGLLIFLLPILDRGKARRMRKRPFFALVAFLFFVGLIGLGVLGYLSDREVELFGQRYRFTTKGYPVRVEGEAQTGSATESDSSTESASKSQTPSDKEPASDAEAQQASAGTCGGCHEDQLDEWTGSAHALVDVHCTSCHGGLDTPPPEKFPVQLEQAVAALKELETKAAEDEEEFWPEEITTDADKRLYLYAHQGIAVNRRGEPTAPRRPEHPAFCGSSCHRAAFQAFEGAVISHLDVDPVKSCVSCHDNHKVQIAGDSVYDKGYAQDDADEGGKGARFHLIRSYFRNATSLLDDARGHLARLEEISYPTREFAEEAAAIDRKIHALRPLMHKLDPALLNEGNEEIDGFTTIQERLAKLQAEMAAPFTSRDERWIFVAAVWGAAVLLALVLGLRLRGLRRGVRHEAAGSDDPIEAAMAEIEAMDERAALLKPLEDDSEARRPDNDDDLSGPTHFLDKN